MNKFIINEEEKRRILMMHESATKRQYLNEERDGTKVKIFSDKSRTVVADTGTINRISQWDDSLGFLIFVTSGDEVGRLVNYNSGKEYFYYSDKIGFFSEAIHQKIVDIIKKENLDDVPMKACVYNLDGSLTHCWFVRNLEVVGYGVDFEFKTYESYEQDTLDGTQINEDPSSDFEKGSFSCNTKKLTLYSKEYKFSDELTNMMMSMCDEYAMSNKDKESDMA